jgi:signal transduction histidine kinase
MADERDPVAALAHDLRSPLAVIELYSGMLEQGAGRLGEDKRAEYVARIRRAVGDMRDALDRATAP